MVSLLDWRKRQWPRITMAQFAKQIGVHHSTIPRYEMVHTAPEHRVPHRAVMRKIFLATGGEVEPNDFYPLDEWRAELAVNDDRPRAARRRDGSSVDPANNA